MAHNPRPATAHPDVSEVPLTAVLRALSDPTRLAIVRTLSAEPVGRACGTFDVEVAASTLSHHFRVLRDAGLIRQEDRGAKRWTQLRSTEFERRFPGLLQAVLSQRPGSRSLPN